MHSEARVHDFFKEGKRRIFYKTGSVHGFAVSLSPSGGETLSDPFENIASKISQKDAKWHLITSFHVSVHLGIYHGYRMQRRSKRKWHACTEHSNPLPHLHPTNTMQNIGSHTLYICYKRLIKLRPSLELITKYNLIWQKKRLKAIH